MDALTHILRLKNEAEFTWGQNSKRLLRRSRSICLNHWFSRRLREVFLLDFYVAAEDKVVGAVLTQKTEEKEYIITYVG